MTVTAKQFGEMHGVDYAIAAATLRFLVGKGVVREAGTVPGKGRTANLFTVPETPITLNLSKNEPNVGINDSGKMAS